MVLNNMDYQTEILKETLVSRYDINTFEDIKNNDGLYYKSFMEGLFDGSIKQNITYEEMMEKQMSSNFDNDFEAIAEHYENLIKGKKRYEKHQKENNKIQNI